MKLPHAVFLTVLSSVPASRGATIYALGESGGNLFSFDSATPGTVVNNQSLTGVPSGQSPRAIDFRPSNGRLYMLSTGSTTSDARLYTLNLATGAATVVGSLTLTGATGLRHSMDWNPVTGNLHIVSAASRTQYEVNPATLAVTQLTTFAAGTNYSDIAFDNNVSGSASTSAYLYDYSTDELRRATNLSTASVVTLGAPFGAFLTNASSQGMDINAADGFAYFNTDMFDGPLAGTGEHLFAIDLTTAAATDLGGIGLPTLDISVQPIPEPSAAALLVALGLLSLQRRR